jgi:hypothetical protein
MYSVVARPAYCLYDKHTVQFVRFLSSFCYARNVLIIILLLCLRFLINQNALRANNMFTLRYADYTVLLKRVA